MKTAGKLRNMLFGTSLLLTALGVFIVLQPDSSLKIIVYCLATVILCLGLFDLITFLINKEERASLWYILARAIVFFVLGIFMFARTEYVSSFVPFLFGLVLVIDGLSKLVTAIEIKKSLNTWSSVLILGILILAVGVVIILNPFKVARLTMMVIGVSLICDGVFNIWAQINHHKHIKVQSALVEVESKDIDEK